MERNDGHGHAANLHRRQPTHGRQSPSAADLDVNDFKQHWALLRRELVGNGPARSARARAPAQRALLAKPRRFVHDAVNFIGERIANGGYLLVRRLDAGDASDDAAQLADAETHGDQVSEDFVLGLVPMTCGVDQRRRRTSSGEGGSRQRRRILRQLKEKHVIKQFNPETRAPRFER